MRNSMKCFLIVSASLVVVACGGGSPSEQSEVEQQPVEASEEPRVETRDKTTGEVIVERTTGDEGATEGRPVGGNKYDTIEEAVNATLGGSEDDSGSDGDTGSGGQG